MADVRAQRVDLPLLAVQRQDVVAPARVRPEALVEGAVQLLPLALEPLRERPVAPDLARELGHSQLRVVDVALHFCGRDRRGGNRAVMESMRIARVLPGLVREAARTATLVFEEAVAVPVPVLVDPGERAHSRIPQLANKRRAVGPPP